MSEHVSDPAPTRDPHTGHFLRVTPRCSCGWQGQPIPHEEPDTTGRTAREAARTLAEATARTMRRAHAAHAQHTGDRSLIARHHAA